MGFVTPEELWLKNEGKQWFKNGLDNTLNILPHLFEKDKVIELFNDITEGKKPFDFSIWRILLLGKWYEMIATNK